MRAASGELMIKASACTTAARARQYQLVCTSRAQREGRMTGEQRLQGAVGMPEVRRGCHRGRQEPEVAHGPGQRPEQRGRARCVGHGTANVDRVQTAVLCLAPLVTCSTDESMPCLNVEFAHHHHGNVHAIDKPGSRCQADIAS